jgi:hypothetical protein
LFKNKMSRRMVTILLLTSMIIAVVWKMTTPEMYMGTWIWNTSILEKQQQSILHFASQNHITHLYVWVNPTNAKKETYQKFIQAANMNHIKVEALAGDPVWATLEGQKNITQFITWVKNYNQSVSPPHRFSGVHLDIEPYLLPDWNTNREKVVKEWMLNMDMVSRVTKESLPGLTRTVDLPFWINSLKTPASNENVSAWMMRKFDHISIMAYRDTGIGPNSIYELSAPIVQEAGRLNKSVIIDVEMNPVQESGDTTFNKKGPHKMKQELKKVQNKFYFSSGFLGFAVHDYSAWKHSYESK